METEIKRRISRIKCDSTFTKRQVSSLDKRVCPRATTAFSKTASYGRFSYPPLYLHCAAPPASNNRLRARLFLPFRKKETPDTCGMSLHVFTQKRYWHKRTASFPASPRKTHRHGAKRYADVGQWGSCDFCMYRLKTCVLSTK